MPIYDFEDLETGEIWTDEMSYSKKAKYCEDNNCRTIFLSTPQVVGTSKDIYAKSSDDFKDRMKNIKKGYPTTGKNAAKMENW